jgi:hypothetical protein
MFPGSRFWAHGYGMRPLAVLLALTLLLAGCEVPAPAPDGTAAPAAPAGATTELDTLTVAAEVSMAGYSREKFPHWIGQGGGCDTRDTVLKRDGKNVKATQDCKITSGSWYSVYDKKSFTDAGDLDVDHMVPLAAAWRSGAKEWTDEKRSEFANDLTRPQLIAVSASSNRAKGDQTPAQWKPSNTAYHCEYAQHWITVKAFWKLSVTEKEKAALREMLGTCRTQQSASQT